MKLFKMKDWDVQVTEEAWALPVFKEILDRDKSKEKEIAFKEISFIYFYCDIKSDFIIIPEKEREEVIKDELHLPKKWKADKVIFEGIRIYKKYSQTTIQKLYQQSLKSAQDIGDYLENTDVLLNERDINDRPVYDISKITTALGRIPKIMADLKAAYKEVVKEQDDMEGKKKGSRTMNTFEDGIHVD